MAACLDDQDVGERQLKGVDRNIDVPIGNIDTTVITNAAAFTLNLISAGEGSWNRIGRKVFLKNINIRCEIVWAYQPIVPTEILNQGMLRMVVVYDRWSGGGAIPTFNKIFGKTNVNGAESTSWHDDIKFDVTDRFEILLDKFYTAKADVYNAVNLTRWNKLVQEKICLEGRETVFGGQGGTEIDINGGAIYVYFRGTSSTYTYWIVDDSNVRLRYYDY